jgi:creatinine amidohydrolase/Fe(II)-dependent formamide hydrolase-like protein
VAWYAQTAKITPSGVFGDPTRATREKGERRGEAMVEHLVALVTSIQGLSLDEIHQTRL